MKLIRIAERDGWDTVREYMSDDVASGSEDEKSLTKAIKTAAAKKEKLKKRKPYYIASRAPTTRS